MKVWAHVMGEMVEGRIGIFLNLSKEHFNEKINI